MIQSDHQGIEVDQCKIKQKCGMNLFLINNKETQIVIDDTTAKKSMSSNYDVQLPCPNHRNVCLFLCLGLHIEWDFDVKG